MTDINGMLQEVHIANGNVLLISKRIVKKIGILDGNEATVNVYSNDSSCHGIEFPICNTEKVYTLINEYNPPPSLLSNYSISICQYSLLEKYGDDKRWNLSRKLTF